MDTRHATDAGPATPIGTADDKAFATLQAQAALAGITLFRTGHGDYMVSRWSWSRTLPDLAAVEALMRKMGVRS